MRKLLMIVMALVLAPMAQADEGMYLPTQLKKIKKQLKEAGANLKPKDIYNEKKPSLKDAIVSLGGFCTGEIISPKGLMLTNHHCGYDAIRENSTPENDYLTDGFWAKNNAEEKPIPGLTVSVVVRIDDVTKTFNKFLKEATTEGERADIISAVSDMLSTEAMEGGYYEAEVKSFYGGSEFYLFVYETFQDVRLVGAPPSAIGKYGGDTDNWMWERHTGDFSMFRIYADADNKSAPYSTSNKPYKPKHFLPISLKGVQPDDFAMVMGFPGSTDRYLTSYGVKSAIDLDQPRRVKIRGEKLRLMKEDMNASDEVRLQYASTYAQVSNYWKYFIGQSEQLKNNKVAQQKEAIEKSFTNWVNAKEKRQLRYGNVLKDIEESYVVLNELNPTKVYFFEAIYSVGINRFMVKHIRLYNMLKDTETKPGRIDKITNNLEGGAEEFFSTFNAPTEQKILTRMFEMYSNDVPKDQQPERFKQFAEESDGNWERLVRQSLKSSVFTDKDRYMTFLKNPTLTVLEDEILFMINETMLTNYLETMNSPEAIAAQTKLDRANRLFIEALRDMNPKKIYYPDANFSLRITFGNVLPYTSNQGKKYKHFTDIDGLMAKEDPNNPEFIVPAKLKELYEAKDYGRYAENGTLPVNFISNNDITGGNSGSPVINADGELIGCAFDGNWEAMSGDIAFEKEFQRTISVDIRYVLFVIDKYAGAQHLIDEMEIHE